MKISTRYIATSILLSTLVVLLVLFGVSIFIEMANELRSIGKGDYNITHALYYVLLIVPADVYSFFPMAGLVGALIGLGILANNSELMVLRASGMSIVAIAKAVLLAALVLSLFMMLLGELLVPRFNDLANTVKVQALYGHQAIATQRGLWVKKQANFMHISKVINQNRLLEVTRYQFNQSHQLEALDYAASVEFVDNHWVAHNIKTSIINDNQVLTKQSASEIWPLDLNPKILKAGADDPTQMSLPALVRYIHYREGIGLATKSFWVMFYQRLLQPLASLVMILLAVPFVFGSLRSGTMGYRILIGAVWGMGFYLFNQFFGQLSVVFEFPAFVGAASPVLFFAVVGVLLMRRAN